MKETDFAEVEEELRSRGKDEEVELLREFVASLPALEQRLPDEVFEGSRVFSGSARAAELLTYGGGHTESDAFLLVPDLRVLFAGDLVLVQSHAWVGDGELPEWLRILDRIEALEFDVLVPGHGPVGGRGDVGAMRAYLEDVLAAAPDAAVPERYSGWDFADGWSRNLDAVAAR
jgi:cyclase